MLKMAMLIIEYTLINIFIYFKVNTNSNQPETNEMLEDPIYSKSVFCIIHKAEKVTHICNDLQCHSNPLLCSQCFLDNMHTHYHFNHENAI